jgi:hypothetical protein
VYAKNVFDRQNFSRGGPAFGILGNPTGYNELAVPPGRLVGVQLQYEFANER